MHTFCVDFDGFKQRISYIENTESTGYATLFFKKDNLRLHFFVNYHLSQSCHFTNRGISVYTSSIIITVYEVLVVPWRTNTFHDKLSFTITFYNQVCIACTLTIFQSEESIRRKKAASVFAYPLRIKWWVRKHLILKQSATWEPVKHPCTIRTNFELVKFQEHQPHQLSTLTSLK